MCKSCQYCLESIYWHLIEKRFCYDESIALYEEPRKSEKNNNFSDYMAYYDQVSIIAGRSIVTIEPITTPPKPIEQQPSRLKLRWWEDEADKENKLNEEKQKQTIVEVPKIHTISVSHVDVTDSHEDITDSGNVSSTSLNVSTETIASTNIPSIISISDKIGNKKNDEFISNTQKSNLTIHDNAPTQTNTSLLTVETIQPRRKSLRERRMSRSLTLDLDRHLELPIIRQSSMPKFYLDTPEVNQTESSILKTASAALSPAQNRNKFEFFDLRSVVQLEKEFKAHYPHRYRVPVHKQNNNPSSRLSHIREKLKPLKIKRQASLSNLPHSIQHI